MPASYHSTCCVSVQPVWCFGAKSRCVEARGGSPRESRRSNLFLEQIQKVAIAFRLIEDKCYSNMLSFSAGGFGSSSAFK